MLIAIREEMARDADFDTDLYLEMVRTGRKAISSRKYSLTEVADEASVKTKKSKPKTK